MVKYKILYQDYDERVGKSISEMKEEIIDTEINTFFYLALNPQDMKDMYEATFNVGAPLDKKIRVNRVLVC